MEPLNTVNAVQNDRGRARQIRQYILQPPQPFFQIGSPKGFQPDFERVIKGAMPSGIGLPTESGSN